MKMYSIDSPLNDCRYWPECNWRCTFSFWLHSTLQLLLKSFHESWSCNFSRFIHLNASYLWHVNCRVHCYVSKWWHKFWWEADMYTFLYFFLFLCRSLVDIFGRISQHIFLISQSVLISNYVYYNRLRQCNVPSITNSKW